MFYRKPPGSFGSGFDPFDTNNLMTPLVATPRPQPIPQPVTLPNSGYPLLDLISGLSQVFTRPKPTMVGYPDPTPTFPQTTDYGWPEDGGIWEKPPQHSRPPLSGDFGPTTLFPKPWNDDAGQNDWLTRWNILPAQDARYLPTFPETEDNTTGAQLSRNWHNAYKDYAFGQIQNNAPQFVEHMPQPKPEQSYGDFMGEVKNTASTLVNQAAGFLGSGIGQALGFIPGVGAVMELIGKGANLAGTVADATGVGGEKAGATLNLLGSVANGAAGGVSAANTEEYGPPMPNADQMPQENYGPPMPKSGQMQPPPTISGKQPTPQAESNFDQSLPIILREEGGLANRPPKEDPGGKTMSGITQSTYDAWLKKNGSGTNPDWPKDVSELKDNQIRDFYREEIYYGKRLDEIQDPKIRHVTFDGSTMSSPQGVADYTGKAIKDVLPNVDLGKPGVMGSKYIGAMNKIAEKGLTDDFLEKLADRRTDFLKNLPDGSGDLLYKKNPGWFRRVDSQRPSNPNNIFGKLGTSGQK